MSGFILMRVERILSLSPIELGGTDLAKQHFSLRQVITIQLMEQMEMLGRRTLVGAPQSLAIETHGFRSSHFALTVAGNHVNPPP
jgi:hypothetical protein